MDSKDILHAKTYRDRVSTVTEGGKRNWVYALKPDGKYYNARNIVSYLYIVLFFAIPFIKIDELPLFLFNVVEGKFILFSKIFWPQDFFIFAIAMITFIIFIALFTVIYGRLFCGWACPQTVFMELIFRKIEWWIEGSPAQQKQLEKSDWTTEKIWKKTLKHTLFLLLSFLIANTFLTYILGTDEVGKIISEPLSQHVGLFSGLIIFTLLFYGVFAFVREIVCTTICPYGRLQGVLFDKDTMQVAYDYTRGEERGKMNKKETVRTKGDCIDCNKCVLVCPTGIDIRNGLQLDCVACTACIDACDNVMEKIGFEKGLIRYASENELKTGEKFHFNTRMKAYSALLVALILFMAGLIITRKPIDTYVSRVKGQLFQEVGDTALSNLYAAKIINKTKKEATVQLKLEGISGEVRLVSTHKTLNLKKEAVEEVTFFIDIPKKAIQHHSTEIKIGVYEGQEKIQTIKTTFLGPFS